MNFYGASGAHTYNHNFNMEGVTNMPSVMGKSVLIQKGVRTGDSHMHNSGEATGGSADQSASVKLDLPVPGGLMLVQLQNLPTTKGPAYHKIAELDPY